MATKMITYRVFFVNIGFTKFSFPIITVFSKLMSLIVKFPNITLFYSQLFPIKIYQQLIPNPTFQFPKTIKIQAN